MATRTRIRCPGNLVSGCVCGCVHTYMGVHSSVNQLCSCLFVVFKSTSVCVCTIVMYHMSIALYVLYIFQLVVIGTITCWTSVHRLLMYYLQYGELMIFITLLTNKQLMSLLLLILFICCYYCYQVYILYCIRSKYTFLSPVQYTCVSGRTCVANGYSCLGVCPQGESVCPTTDVCHSVTLETTCDGSNVTCLRGQVLVQDENGIRTCQNPGR